MKNLFLSLLVLSGALSGCIGVDYVGGLMIEKVEVTNPLVALGIGDSHQFEIVYTNKQGVMDNATVTWTSSDESIATITNQGLVTGLREGKSLISLQANDVAINFSLDVGAETVVSTGRTAIFQGNNGYNASGMATLFLNENEQLILTFSDDFQTSFALGTFIYLSNSIDGSVVKSSGLDIGEITTGGAKTFNITNTDPTAGIETYQYVIVLCKPAGITFGFADFNK